MASLGRHSMAGLIFFGVMLTYMLRVNLSVAILAMVNQTALANQELEKLINGNFSEPGAGEVCPRINDTEETQHRDGPFLWNQKTRGLILGSFFYGYVITELPGGWLAYRFGAKWVLGMGILWTSIFTLLTPLTVYLDLHMLIAIRVLEGLGEGVAFPCTHALFAQWVPPSERSRIPALTLSGLSIGTVIAFPLSATLCNTTTGWPLVFYVFGVMGLCWCVVWFIFGSSTPAESRWISQEEQKYIRMSLEETVVEERPGSGTVPWKEIFTTPAMWALWISNIAGTWGWHTLIILLPTFFNEVLHMGIAKNGVMAGLPYLFFTIVAIASGPIADSILARRYVSVGTLRKVAEMLSHVLPGIFLLLVTGVGCDISMAVILMCAAVGSEGFGAVGGFANNLDVAGRYAGVTSGISSSMSSICGIIAPYVAGAITEGSTSMYRWRIVFGIVAGLYWISTIVYVLFAQGHPAKWALVEKKSKSKSDSSQIAKLKNVVESACVRIAPSLNSVTFSANDDDILYVRMT